MAKVDMGASPQRKNNTKPKLAAKPPMMLLETRSSASWLRSPSPDAASRSGAKGSDERSRTLQLMQYDDRRSISPHAIAGECETRAGDTGNIPANIHTTPVTLRQGRRKTNKPPKPLPYLEPISSRTVREGRHSFAGRLTSRVRKRLSLTKSVKYPRFPIRRATKVNNDKLPRRPVVAYLVVDIVSGTVVYSSGKYH